MTNLPTNSDNQEPANDITAHLSEDEIDFMAAYAKEPEQLRQHALKYFPNVKNPVKKAERLMRQLDTDRVVLEYFCNRFGLSDPNLVAEMATGMKMLSWAEPKEATIKLQLIDKLFKVKGRYDTGNSTGMTLKGTNITVNQQNNQLQKFVSNARKEMDDEELLNLFSDTTNILKTAVTKPSDEDLFSSEDTIGKINDSKEDEDVQDLQEGTDFRDVSQESEDD